LDRLVESITLGLRAAGHGHPCFVIAEAGVNHNGSIDTALRMVDVARACSADAIKFQLFDADRLAAESAITAAYQDKNRSRVSQRAMLKKLALPFDEFVRIKRHCDAQSLMMLVTPFGSDEVSQIVEMGLPAIKIASTDLTTAPLLEAASRTGLPLIVSTGASTPEEIEAAVWLIDAKGARDRLILLHCVSAYPAPLEAANLGAIGTLQRTFCVPTGFSDHTTSTRTGALAVASGACVLEKHFTLDPSDSGPDHAMSLNPDQLREYVDRVREAESAMGSGVLGMNPIESEVREIARKSIVSAADIHAGQNITVDMLTLKRPGTGLGSDDLARVIGRRALVDIPRDTVLDWNMTCA